jgi:hypothetical protein
MRDPRNGWRHGERAFQEGRAISHLAAELACPSGPACGVEGAALPGFISFRGSLRTLCGVVPLDKLDRWSPPTLAGRRHTRAPDRPLGRGGKEVHRSGKSVPVRARPPAGHCARPLGSEDGKPAAFPLLGPQPQRLPLPVSGSLRTAESSPGCPNEVWRRNHRPIIELSAILPGQGS